MSLFQVSYDLKAPSKDYDELYEALKSYPGYAHILESTWFISSTKSDAGDIRDDLKEHVDGNDRLLVTKFQSGAGCTWATTFSDGYTDWLHDNA